MHRIYEPQQLYLIKKIPLLNRVGFRILKATENLSSVDRTVLRTFELLLRPSVPAALIESSLRRSGVNPGSWLRSSELQLLLRKMLANFVW
jgi:hypothetical protein